MWRPYVCLIFMGMTAAPAAAQTFRPAPGDRVRVQFTEHRAKQVLIFRDMVGDTLVLQKPEAGATLRMPLQQVRKFQISRGERSFGSRTLRGAGWGFVAGAVIGAVSGLADGDGEPRIELFSAEAKAMLGAFFLGGTGAVVGAVVGGVSNSERWQTVSLDRVTVAATKRGAITVGYRLVL